MYSAILFDLDGVLVDSNDVSEKHWRLWASEAGIDPTPILKSHHGVPTRQLIEKYAPHLDAEAEAVRKETREAKETDGLMLFAGVDRLLRSIPEGQWAIVTSGTRTTAMTRIDYVGMPHPKVLITADDVKNGKPDPEPYLLAAKGLGIDPSECLVVEDAPSGVAAGKAAGADVFAVMTTNAAENTAAADRHVPAAGALRVYVEDGKLQVTIAT